MEGGANIPNSGFGNKEVELLRSLINKSLKWLLTKFPWIVSPPVPNIMSSIIISV